MSLVPILTNAGSLWLQSTRCILLSSSLALSFGNGRIGSTVQCHHGWMDGWMDGVSNIKGLYNLILLTTKSHVLTNRITDDFSSFPIKHTVSNLFNLINAFSFLRSSTSTLENVTQSVVSGSFYGTSWCWQEVSSPRNKRLASYLSAHCYITFVCLYVWYQHFDMSI